MTGKSELHVTGTTSPISGSTINLNSPDAWFWLDNIRPSVVSSTYLSQIKVNGATANLSTNCRVVQYTDGTVVIPQSPGFGAMEVFSGPLFTGTSMALTPYTQYGGNSLGALANNISSFKLKRGYTATIAQYSNGTGISKNYVAQDCDIEVSLLPNELNNAVSFVRVFPWRWTSKKGVGGNPGNSKLNLRWWYNWDITSSSTLDLEYVPIRQHTNRPSLDQDWAARGSSQLLGYNEPDRPDQSNMSVSTAISLWPDLLATGMRVGAPAVSDGGRDWWLYPFMQQADSARLRVDYLPIHYYQGHNPSDPAGAATQMYNYLKGVYDKTKRPIWVTEWNNGANWTNSGDPTYQQQAACIAAMQDMLENAPFVERYAIYNWVEDVRGVIVSGSLTPAGVVYRDKVSKLAYTQVLPESPLPAGALYRFEGDARDSSGNGQHGSLHGTGQFTTGKTGQAVVLNSTTTNADYVQLPATLGDSTDFTFGAWVKWDGSSNNQKVFELANGPQGLASKYLYLTPSSDQGKVKFAIYNGSAQQELNDSVALPTNTWTHVAVTINGNTGKLFINGSLKVTNSAMSINPADIGTTDNFLARGRKATDPLFAGQLDQVQFLPIALTDAQVAKMATNTAPQFTLNPVSAAAGTPGIAYNSTIAGSATDADGDAITYAKISGASWLSVAADGSLSGIPPSGAEGVQEFIVSATDTAGATSTAVLTIQLPTLSGNGIWTSLTGVNWNTTSNWLNDFPASGAGNKADFSTLDIPADKTVTLNGSRTIGGLTFGDTTGTQSWTLNSSNSSKLTLAGEAPPIVVKQNTATISAPLAGAEGLTKSGPGTLILSGSNSYLGDTLISAGLLNLQNSAALGSNTVVKQSSGGRNAGIQLQGNIALPSGVDFVLSNDGGLAAAATVPYAIGNVSGNNSISGLIYLTTGGGSSVIQSDSGALTLAGTIKPEHRIGERTLILQGASTAANTVSGTLSDNTGTSDDLSLIKTGTGTWLLSGNNTYSDGTTLLSGRLDIGNNAALGTGRLTINGGTIVPRGGGRSLSNSILVGGDFTLHDVAGLNNSLTLSGPMNLGGTSRTITVSEAVNGVDTTLSGVISNGALTKAGPGTLVLSGNNTYSGDTTVSAGALMLGAANVIADSSNMTLSGGTFATGGFNETVGTLSLAEDSTLDLGAGASTLTYSGVGTFADGKTLTVTNWTEGSDHLFIGSSALLNATQLAQIKFGALGAQQLATGEVVPAAGLPAGIMVTPTSGLTTSEAGGTASFTVKLNSQPTADVTLTLSSSDTTEGTVAPASLTFTAANWDTAQTVTVTGIDDNVDDDDIPYTVVTAPATSTDAAYDTLDASDVAITNTDDEGLPALSINDVTGQEAYSGTTDATFTLSLSHPSTKTISVNYATANGSATAGSDYTAKSGTLTLPAGSTSATLTIAITGDTTTEGDQTFLVNLSAPVNATLGDGQGQGIIQDSPPLVPVVIIKTPLPDQKMLISAFKSGSLSGTANDNLGVTKVEVKITRLRGGVVQTWNGTTFATTSVRVPATITGSGTKVSWALSTAFPPQAQLDEGEYIVVVYATDADGNSGSATTRLTLYPGDTQAPVAQIFTPTLNQKILLSTFTSGAANTLSGNALDNVGINSLRLRFSRKRNGVNQYWNGSAFTTLGLFLSATVTPVGSTSPKWNLDSQMPPLSALDSGLYQIEAYAVDIAGNKSPTLTRPFTLGTDFTAPSVAIVAPTQGQKMALNTLVAGTVNGTAGDNLGVVSVKVKLMRKRGTVTTYWNGTAFTSTTATVDASVTTVGGTSVTWSLTNVPTSSQGLDTGSYTLYAAAYDAAGNTRSSASRSFYLTASSTATAAVSDPTSSSVRSAGSS